MPREARVKVDPTTPGYYHVYTKVTQNSFLLVDEEDKKQFIQLVFLLIKTFFVKILAFQVMDNHYHLVLKVEIPENISDEELKARFHNLYPDKEFNVHEREKYIEKWGDLSKFMHSLNQRYAMYFNRKHNTSGHFWGNRFDSSILSDDEAIALCATYVDLNAVRANMVEECEEYEYGSVNYVVNKKNEGDGIAISEISRLFQGIKVGEMEEEIRERYGKALSYLKEEEREGYLRYLEFVEIRKRNGFLRKIKSFRKRAILGMRQSIEAILPRLSNIGSLRYYTAKIPNSSLAIAR